MSQYFTIRAFIDCDDDELVGIKALIQSLGTVNDLGIDDERAALYRQGWCFRDIDMNWIKHAFYGGSVRGNGRDLVMADIAKIANSFPQVEGMVVIDNDDGDAREFWIIKDGQLIKTAD